MTRGAPLKHGYASKRQAVPSFSIQAKRRTLMSFLASSTKPPLDSQRSSEASESYELCPVYWLRQTVGG